MNVKNLLFLPLPAQPTVEMLRAAHVEVVAFLDTLPRSDKPDFDQGDIVAGVDRLADIRRVCPADLRAELFGPDDAQMAPSR